MSIPSLRDRLAAAPPVHRSALFTHWERRGGDLHPAAWQDPAALYAVAELLLEYPRASSARTLVSACRGAALQVSCGATWPQDLALARCAVRALLVLDLPHEAWPVLAALERAGAGGIASLVEQPAYRAWAVRALLRCEWTLTPGGPAARMPAAQGAPVHVHRLEPVVEVPTARPSVRLLRVPGGRGLEVGRRDLTGVGRRLGVGDGVLGWGFARAA
jgi:hypothetical protein